MADYLLDTNICLRLANTNAEQHLLLSAVVKTLLRQGNRLAVVPQNFYELWSVAMRPVANNGFGWDTSRTRQAVDSLRSSFILLVDTPDVLTNWLELVTTHDVKGKQVHDARLVAAMQTHGLTNILTLNVKDFERYPVTPVHPDDVSRG